jgi:hypothetical protein
MRRRTIPEWERRLRTVAAHLTSSVQGIFGSISAVAYTPPDGPPQRANNQSNAHPYRATHVANRADQLSPRERRGHD